MSRPVTFTQVESFEIRPIDELDPDMLEVRLSDEHSDSYFVFSGANQYPTEMGGVISKPKSEDFLQQFAAYLGYRVVKD